MKSKLVIAILFVAFMGACTQKTCPTYAKNDVKSSKENTASVRP